MFATLVGVILQPIAITLDTKPVERADTTSKIGTRCLCPRPTPVRWRCETCTKPLGFFGLLRAWLE